MIIDSSALVAVVRKESGFRSFVDAIADAEVRRLSAANYLETSIVIDGTRDPLLIREYDEILDSAEIQVEPVTVEQAAVARAAYRDFGKGSGHPAQLTFGDCFAYALAAVTREPLLYKGDDFTQAGVRSAVN